MVRRIFWVLLLVCSVFFFGGCVGRYRTESRVRRVARPVVQREKRLLRRRIRFWRNRIDDMYRYSRDPIYAKKRVSHLRRRVRRARRVMRMFRRKLAEYGEWVRFYRYEWRRAYNVGCRMYRY